MSHPDRKKQKEKKREEMIGYKSLDIPDPTPYQAVKNIVLSQRQAV